MKPDFECQCSGCQVGCSYKPGWFVPGEIEVAAASLGLTPQDFFDQYLGVDWFEMSCAEPIFVISPALVGMNPGGVFPADPRGACVFFKDGLCSIHEVKPYECAVACHEVDDAHREVAMLWKDQKNQKEITELLGYEPVARRFTSLDSLGF